MKICKFGGASINSIERIQSLPNIIATQHDTPLVLIISAMGKTTNALENVVNAFYKGQQQEALNFFQIIKQQHLNAAKYLLVKTFNPCLQQLNDFFTEVEWLLYDKPVREYDYYYDQVVCIGELLSSCIVHYFLTERGFDSQWLDVRDLLRTNNTFRDAQIDWEISKERIRQVVKVPADDTLDAHKQPLPIFITQGFIGATDDNESTTLGREGSDYTAAIFASILDATLVTIWKDVAGVLNADPRLFPDAQLIDQLSYREVIEMAYYGAQVIHPKTIKPLQNKHIPLQVKCFLQPAMPGTLITDKNSKQLPPITIIKSGQAMIHLRSLDFSFVEDALIQQLYQIFTQWHIHPNLVQTGAISLQICIDDQPDKIEQFAITAGSLFDVQIERNLSLLTIRHYTKETIEALTTHKLAVLTQKTKETYQLVYQTEV
jgi:aspartate kinase